MEGSMDSYSRVVDDCLWKILRYLPRRQLYSARSVNKDWEAAACQALCQSNKFTFHHREKISDFILTFFDHSQPMQLLSAVTVHIDVMAIILQRLEMFGTWHGPLVRSLHLLLPRCDPDPRAPHRGQRSTQSAGDAGGTDSKTFLESKVKVFLRHFPALTNLSMSHEATWAARLPTASEFSEIQVVELPQFGHLQQLDFKIKTHKIPLLHDIIVKAPPLCTLTLDLKEVGQMPSATDNFLTILQERNIEKLGIFLNAEDASRDNAFLQKLVQSEVMPKELLLCFRLMHDARDAKVEERRNLTFDFLTKVTRNERLTKLSFRTTENMMRLKLPVDMPFLTEMNFAVMTFHERNFCESGAGNFEIVPPICQGQVPALRKLVIPSNGKQLNFDEVFTSVQDLNILGELTDESVRTTRQQVPSYDWTTKFPNLTKLEMVVEEDGSLTSVLTHMLTLAQLKLNFKRKRETRDPEDGVRQEVVDGWWDAITGRSRPILDDESLYDLITTENLDETRTAYTAQANDATARLGNLHNLKTLYLENAPTSIVIAVIYVTAIEQIPRLNILKVSSDYDPEDACIEVLEEYHDLVDLDP